MNNLTDLYEYRKKQLDLLQKLNQQIKELESCKVAEDFKYVFETESGILLSALQKREEEIGNQISKLNIEMYQIAGRINILKVKTAKESGLLKQAEWELGYYPEIQIYLKCKKSDVCAELRKLFDPKECEFFDLTENCHMVFENGQVTINIRRPFSFSKKGLLDLIKTLDINVVPSKEMMEIVSKNDKKVEETKEMIEELMVLNDKNN